MLEEDEKQALAAGGEQPAETEEDKQRRTLFHDTRKTYVANQYDQSNLRDKYILTLSAAALGISVTYIDKIVSLAEAKCIALLVFSWIFFGCSLASVVYSYCLSVLCYGHYIKQMDEKFANGEDFQDIGSPCDRYVECLNQFSMWCFIIGLIFFIVFATINVVSKTAL